MGDINITKPHRILVLSTALAGGGAEAVARLMVERLNGSFCILFENDGNIAVPGHKIHVIFRRNTRSLLLLLLINMWRVLVVQLVKLWKNPELTISHLEGPNFANLLTFYGGRRILFVHNQIGKNYGRKKFSDKLKKTLILVLYRRADCIVGVSTEICAELINSFGVHPERVLFLPNPIDREAISLASVKNFRDIRDHLCDGRYLVNLGNLTSQKNHEMLLRVYNELINRDSSCNDLKLVLIGDGDRRQALINLCEELGLKTFVRGQTSISQSNQVCFMGFQSNPYPFLKHAKLLVMTSLWEGLPIALLEAMSLGLPAVVSDCSSGIQSIWEIPEKLSGHIPRESCHWTSYGAVISAMGNNDIHLRLWSETISRLLEDTALYNQCSVACWNRMKHYDIGRISKIWESTLLGSQGL